MMTFGAQSRPTFRLWRPLMRVVIGGGVCALALGASLPSASAFEIFGFKLFGGDDADDAGIVDPLTYSVTLEAPEADADMLAALNGASQLVTEVKRPVSGSLGLLSRARSDRERLVAILYEKARYEGVVDIRIEGRSIDELPPDAQFGGEPIPVSINVNAGPLFKLGQVELKGDAAGLSPTEFGLEQGGDAGSLRILKAERDIVRRLQDDGRPLAKVTGRDVVADHDTTELDVGIDVAAGPVAGYGTTSVSGTETVDRDFTAYMAGLVEGKTYSPAEVDAARERLLGLGVFNNVAVAPAEVLDANGRIPMNVNVTERKLRYYGVGATYSNTEGIGLEGYWGHRNLFGQAEKLRIEGSISGIGDRSGVSKLNYNAGIMFEKPGVIGPASKFYTGLKVVYEHPDAYDRFSTKANAGFAYDLTPAQSVSAELSVDYSRITDAFFRNKQFLIVSTPLQYVFDKRDNKLNPTKGFRLLAFVEPAYDTLNTNAFVKIRGEGSVYQSLDSAGRFVLAGRLAAGSIVGASLDDIPADRRFYSGGGGSVRGYAYQGIGPRLADGTPTGGLSYVEASVEMRYSLTDTIGIVPFVDVGTVSATEYPDFSQIKAGAGIGLRYLTPFGPLRIDGAIPLNKGPGDPDFGIYAGIGQAF
ncbi:MAG: outer membrane protein assembly factor [Rhizobiaceae bacterium]|nr:outer membrane protein assembly factor [Rhizobiaceae bacterium]